MRLDGSYTVTHSLQLTRTAAERDEERRFEFRIHMILNYTSDQLVFVDESSFDRRNIVRTHGYSASGRRAFKRAFLVRKKRYSILPALSKTGMIALSVYQGTFNSDRFLSFILLLLTRMQPYPHPRSVIVLDNCKIHKDPRILNAITSAGMRYEFLPPYSPDLNPIELSFNDIKMRLRRDGDDFRQLDYEGDEGAIITLLHDKVMSVSAEHAQKWFRWSGYRS